MNQISRMCLIFLLYLCTTMAHTQDSNDLLRSFLIISPACPLPDANQKMKYPDTTFRFGMNKKPPFQLGLQFSNQGYETLKLKFAVKDTTTNKMLLLDTVHNSNFGVETLNAISKGAIWKSPVSSNQDLFSLRVWDAQGNEFDTKPIAVKEQ